MATVGKCLSCGAAFVFPKMKGSPICPHCGGDMARTSSQYKGAWFSIAGAGFPYAVSFSPVPARSGEHDADVRETTIRPFYYEHVAAYQEWENAAWWAQRCSEQSTDAELIARSRDALARATVFSDAKRDAWEAARDRYFAPSPSGLPPSVAEALRLYNRVWEMRNAPGVTGADAERLNYLVEHAWQRYERRLRRSTYNPAADV